MEGGASKPVAGVPTPVAGRRLSPAQLDPLALPMAPAAAVAAVAQPEGFSVPVCAAAVPVSYGGLFGGAYAGAGQPAYLWVPVALSHQPHLVTLPAASSLPLAFTRPDPRGGGLRLADPAGAWQAGTLQPVSLPRGLPPGRRTSLAPAGGTQPPSLSQLRVSERTPAKPQRQQRPAQRSEGEEPPAPGDDSADEDGSDSERGGCAPRPPPEAGPCYGTGWDSITEPIMQMVVQRLDGRTQQRCRLVSRRWCYYVTNNLQVLQPRRAKVHTIREKFRALTALDLSGCENVRNRNLAILAASQLPLRSVAVGHAASLTHGKPRITNSALASLSKLPSLTALSLSDCSAITNNGMQVLSALTRLERLAFVRCPRVSEKGLELVQVLPRLASLTVFGCTKVTDRLLELAAGVSSLTALHLGHMRLQPERLAALSAHASLAELSVHGEELSQAALAALAGFSRLRALGMTTCYQVNGPLALSALAQLGGLRRLNIQSFGDLNDAHLMLVAAALPHLEQLKVVLGPSVSAAGVECLGQLRRLTAISCESMQAQPGALGGVSRLEQLRVAEFPGTRLPPPLLAALQALPHLSVLNLTAYEQPSVMHAEMLLVYGDLARLSRCARLTRLDLSNAILPHFMAADLLRRFDARDTAAAARGSAVRLQELCLTGCPIERAHLEQLRRAFPLVHTHQNRRGELPSSTWVWDEACHAAA